MCWTEILPWEQGDPWFRETPIFSDFLWHGEVQTKDVVNMGNKACGAGIIAILLATVLCLTILRMRQGEYTDVEVPS